MKIQKQPDPVLETIMLLALGSDPDKIKAEHIDTLDKTGINGELFYEKYLSGYDTYVRSFIRNRVYGQNDIIFSRDNSEYGDFMICVILQDPDIISNIDQISEVTLQHLIIDTYNEINESEYLSSENPTTNELFEFVSLTDFTDRTKWQLIALLQNPKPLYKRLCTMIMNNIAAYNKAHIECKNYIEKGMQYFIENISTADSLGDIQQKIIPMAALPTSFMVINEKCCYGFYWKAASLPIHSEGIDSDELSAVLKAISDKSRLEILSSLKNTPMYSHEIAEKLGLTPATVSHHMSTLLVRNLVTIEKRDGRGYYYLNYDGIKALLKHLENKLL